MQKFHAFVRRASSCSSIFQFPTSAPISEATPPSSSSKAVLSALSDVKPRVILLEDLPNILHPPTQVAFHSELQSLIEATIPVVVIVSDTGLRGEDLDGINKRNEVIDVRTVLGPLTGSPYVTRISQVNSVFPSFLCLCVFLSLSDSIPSRQLFFGALWKLLWTLTSIKTHRPLASSLPHLPDLQRIYLMRLLRLPTGTSVVL
jgi:hypothetical protein